MCCGAGKCRVSMRAARVCELTCQEQHWIKKGAKSQAVQSRQVRAVQCQHLVPAAPVYVPPVCSVMRLHTYTSAASPTTASRQAGSEQASSAASVATSALPTSLPHARTGNQPFALLLRRCWMWVASACGSRGGKGIRCVVLGSAESRSPNH